MPRRKGVEKTDSWQYDRDLDQVMAWVTQHLEARTNVPRFADVLHHAYADLGYEHLKRADIIRRLRLHPAYLMNSPQTRGRSRWKRYRPILANSLGMLHGDIGYFSVKRQYETPVTFRAGFLVLKDVLSRFTYAVILRKNKSAESMVRAFQDILEQHRQTFGPKGHRIISIAFDQERSVLSHQVQQFFRDNHIAFHPFKYTVSKSKFAEGAIRLVRTEMARILRAHPNKRWWHLMDQVVAILNEKPIYIQHQRLQRTEKEPWRPRDVTKETVLDFCFDLYNADAAKYFAQFNLAPQLIQFKYPVGTVVRPKLLVTSSAVVGEKRSEINLETDSFVVTQHVPYVNARKEAARAYRCKNQRTDQEEIFDEKDLAESVE